MRSLKLYKHPELSRFIMCNEDARIIYIKPPRTAGSSIFRWFLEKKIPGFKNMKDDKSGYRKWAESLTDGLLNEYFIFTSVRNPYDRIVSISKWLKINTRDFITNYYKHILKNSTLKLHAIPYTCANYFNLKKQFDFEIRFESLEDDFKELCKIIQVKHKPLYHVNKTKHRKYKKYYNRDLINKVNDIYENDFNFFNYKMI